MLNEDVDLFYSVRNARCEVLECLRKQQIADAEFTKALEFKTLATLDSVLRAQLGWAGLLAGAAAGAKVGAGVGIAMGGGAMAGTVPVGVIGGHSSSIRTPT